MSFICQWQDDFVSPLKHQVKQPVKHQAKRAKGGSSELIRLFLCGRCHAFGAQEEGSWAVLPSAGAKATDFAPIQPRHKVKKSPVYQWLANVPYQAAPLKITPGEKFLCMPAQDEFAEIALKAGSATAKKLLAAIEFSDDWQDTYEEQVQAAGCRLPLSGSQVGGYPLWMQGYESVQCPQCRGKMELCLQVDGYQCWIGADGFALLFRCAEHKESFQLLVSAT
jgi:hypothetical protein